MKDSITLFHLIQNVSMSNKYFQRYSKFSFFSPGTNLMELPISFFPPCTTIIKRYILINFISKYEKFRLNVNVTLLTFCRSMHLSFHHKLYNAITNVSWPFIKGQENANNEY